MSIQVIGPALSDLDLTRYVNFSDDFYGGSIENGEIGQMGWKTVGSGSVINAIVPSAHGLHNGVRTLRAAAGGGVASLALFENLKGRYPTDFPIGSTMRVRWDFEQITACAFWAGMTNSAAVTPLEANDVGFLGFRFEISVGASIQFIAKDGADSGNEDSVNIVVAEADTFVTVEATRLTVDSYRVTSGGSVKGTLTGVTNFPPTANNVEHTIGAHGTAAASSDVDMIVDFYQSFAPIDRR